MVILFLLPNFLCSPLSQVLKGISGIADKALVSYLLVNDLNASRFSTEYIQNWPVMHVVLFYSVNVMSE